MLPWSMVSSVNDATKISLKTFTRYNNNLRICNMCETLNEKTSSSKHILAQEKVPFHNKKRKKEKQANTFYHGKHPIWEVLKSDDNHNSEYKTDLRYKATARVWNLGWEWRFTIVRNDKVSIHLTTWNHEDQNRAKERGETTLVRGAGCSGQSLDYPEQKEFSLDPSKIQRQTTI